MAFTISRRQKVLFGLLVNSARVAATLLMCRFTTLPPFLYFACYYIINGFRFDFVGRCYPILFHPVFNLGTVEIDYLIRFVKWDLVRTCEFIQV